MHFGENFKHDFKRIYAEVKRVATSEINLRKLRNEFGEPRMTIYGKTVIKMILAIIAVFSVFAIAYIFIFKHNFEEQRAYSLRMTAEAVADEMNGLSDEEISKPDENLISFMMFSARSTESIIWLVDCDGSIVYYSSMPSIVEDYLAKDRAGNYILPYSMRNSSGMQGKGRIGKGNYYGLLSDKDTWISVSHPLESYSGEYRGEIIIHHSSTKDLWRQAYFSTNLMMTYFITILMAILLMFLVAGNLTGTISRLSEVAKEVYLGNYKVRMEYKDYVPMLGDGGRNLSDDGLTLLIKTFNTMVSKLERLESDRSAMVSDISHDLRTPLTSIKGFVNAIADGIVPVEKYPYYTDIILQELNRMQTVLEDMNRLSDDEDTAPQKQVFDINDLIKECVRGLEYMRQEKIINIKLRLDSEEDGLKVYADRDSISRVVYNILSNAIKFTEEGGNIRISTLRNSKKFKDRLIAVLIEDDGPGIAAEDLPKIFERFYKGDKSRGGEGRGLGLHISKEILNKHQQMLEAGKSELGGAAFTFTLESYEAAELEEDERED